ncbi:uncharacterized protein LOC132637273 [Lycium barbarum]|uniref:uncharacterized protein LOC132637273 n=1 Tax=Lycium barbarum TaxID=112863 RepID=UPI00293F6D46|nr:uncharacterized protein LOC132637273 [Lycium barbarum]
MADETTHSIMVQHNGRWDASGRYINFEVEGILYDSKSKFSGLVTVIAAQLGIDTTIQGLEIKYIVSDKCPPMTIHNNMGVHVYLDQKKENKNFFSKYPLCITLRDIALDLIEIQDEGGSSSNSIKSVPSHNGITDQLNAIVPSVDFKAVECQRNGIISDNRYEFVAEKQIYKDKETIVAVMKNYAFSKQFQFRVRRSSSKSYCLECPADECSWSFKSSSLNDSGLFKIRSFCEQHSCSLKDRIYSRRQATTAVVGIMIMDKYEDPKRVYTPKDIASDMRKQHGLTMTYMQAYRAKEKALNMLRGDPTESYNKLPSYFFILEKTYPGSVVSLEKTAEDRFLYAFVALEPCIRGWEYCRPIVVVDGTHLKSTYEGTMLIASTLDPGGSILPLAYAIVDSENNASWTWFFERFRIAFGERENMGNKEQVRKLYFALAKAYTLQEFSELMGRLDTIDKKLGVYLFDSGYHKWSRVHATVKRTWTLTSNIAESINNSIAKAREFPVCKLMDYMRQLIETWNEKHSEEGRNTFTDLTNEYNKAYEDNKELSHRMTVRASTEFLLTVTDGMKIFSVCLRSKICSCGRFQLDEIPCGHALAAIMYRHQHGEDYCSAYYSNKNFKDTYAIPVEPLPCESTWEIPFDVLEQIVLPPDSKRPPGRPSLKRMKPFYEMKFKRAKMTCSKCGIEGHNKKTCSNLPK